MWSQSLDHNLQSYLKLVVSTMLSIWIEVMDPCCNKLKISLHATDTLQVSDIVQICKEELTAAQFKSNPSTCINACTPPLHHSRSLSNSFSLSVTSRAGRGERSNAAGGSLPWAVSREWSMPSTADACCMKHHLSVPIPFVKITSAIKRRHVYLHRENTHQTVFMPEAATAIARG